MAATSDTLIELMAAGRLEQADAVAAARPESYAVALRAMVRMRQGRVAQVAADLRGRAVSQPWMVAPLVDALVERGELDEAQRVLPARARLARDARVLLPARQPGPPAAGPGPRR